MSNRDLLREPIWRGEELGLPIPDSRHAVSVALPRWQDVVGYEEKSPEVMSRLQSGYPRFVIHSLVQEIAGRLGSGNPCLPFPSRRVAELAADFIRRSSGEEARVAEGVGVHAVVTTPGGADALKAFWQHTGLIVSTRQAESILAGRGAKDDAGVRRSLCRQLAAIYDCGEDDVFLQPTGMAAGFAALQAVKARRPGLPTVQIGFPYVDTLKLQEKFGHGTTLLHDVERGGEDLAALLERSQAAGCFSEIPGNPLLGCVDLRKVTPILRAHGVPLVADDVVATPVNVDLRNHADLVATSLTKYMAGTGDAMGGALICNPRSPFYAELKEIVAANHEELLWGEDAVILERQIGGFPERMKRHNENGLFIAEHLRDHPAVEQVWYPKWTSGDAYESVRRPDGGWGSLITFLPKGAESKAQRIYDNLQVCKGPSLGTVFTIACPFTMLAHYTELDWAEACGVSRYLIRISVGLEEPEDLWRRIQGALNEAKQDIGET